MKKQTYTYSQLNQVAQEKARLLYLKEWHENNKNDSFSDEDCHDFLCQSDEPYNEDGSQC